MANKYATFFKWISVIIDYVILNLSLYVAFKLAHPEWGWLDVYDYRLIILLLNLSWFFCSSIFNNYQNILTRDAASTITANIAALCYYTLVVFVLKLFLPHLFVSQMFLVYLFGLFSVFMISWKTGFLFLRRYRRKFWLDHVKIVFVGASPVGLDLYTYIKENPQLGYDVLGIFADNLAPGSPDYTYLGRVEDCIPYAQMNGVQEIFCALPSKKKNRIAELMEQADKYMIRFRLVPHFKVCRTNFQVDTFGNRPIILPRQEPLANKANEMLKRAFDIMFSLTVIVFLLSWLLPILAVIIKLDSKGPVFFKQLRSGKDNKPFYCLKLRSMAPNSDCDSVQACKNDMRVTRVGRFIRKTSLDELPQFFNVLVGDMSVVGPRPHMLKHTQDYSQLINNYMVRHFLTPGITGWAQVNGYRGETKETRAMQNRVQADIWYLENWTLFLDIKIVFLTLWRVLQKDEQAY